MTGNPSQRASHIAQGGAWFILLAAATVLNAAEGPFLITYTHQMEEPRNLEIATKNVTGKPGDGNRFLGSVTELEYGATAWWTTELYLDGQVTRNESALFTGYRWENWFRVLPREHWINPVLYVEFENINGANKSLLEVVGHDGTDDLTTPNADSRYEKKREVEAKLILSSHFNGWTIAENFIAEKNVRHAPYEFGYAAGVSRPLALIASPDRCDLCLENFQAGVEVYGGLGTHESFGLHETSHYVAPTLAWTLANGTTFKVSPGFGSPNKAPAFCCGSVCPTRSRNSDARHAVSSVGAVHEPGCFSIDWLRACHRLVPGSKSCASGPAKRCQYAQPAGGHRADAASGRKAVRTGVCGMPW